MSDGVVVLSAVFALTLIFSGTRIVVAMISRRPVDSARLADLEHHLAALSQQLDELRATTELTERQLAQLSEAQRFTESLLKGSPRAVELMQATSPRGTGQHRDLPSNVR